MGTEHISIHAQTEQGGNIMMQIKTFIEFMKTTLTTAMALIAVMAGSYNFVSDAFDAKIEHIAEQTAIKTFEVFRVEDALFELEKENYKFLTGKSDAIRKQNLELVLKYQRQIVEKYPDKQPQVNWAVKFYQENFVNKFS